METNAGLIELALNYQRAGRLREAEQLCRRVLDLDRNNANAWHYLGVIAYQVGQNDWAIRCIEESISISPNSPDAHYDLGNAYAAKRKLDEGAAAFQRALSLRPHFAEAEANLGNVFLGQGLANAAIECYRRAIALKPGFISGQSKLLYSLQFVPEMTCKEILREHYRYNEYATPPI